MMDQNSVLEIIESALRSHDAEIDDTSDVQWDSLSHVSILVALDTAFDGKLSEIEDLHGAYSVEDIISILQSIGLVD